MWMTWNMNQTRSRLLVCVLTLMVVFAYITVACVKKGEMPPSGLAIKPMVVGETVERASFSEADFNVRGDMGKLLVVSDLKNNYLVPPSPQDVPYNLQHPDVSYPSVVQAFLINRILNGKRDGFFIECGAYDGEYMSNTLMFERYYNWTGLLIEPSPPLYKKLLTKNRKAYLSPTCLSKSTFVETVMFENNEEARSPKIHDGEGPANNKYRKTGNVHLDDDEEIMNATNRNVTRVQCFPLYSYLLALNRKTVDYLSLDVEGFELHMLQTIPWKMVDIRTLSVQFFAQNEAENKQALRSYMEDVGYTLNTEVVVRPDHAADDYIFVKKEDPM